MNMYQWRHRIKEYLEFNYTKAEIIQFLMYILKKRNEKLLIECMQKYLNSKLNLYKDLADELTEMKDKYYEVENDVSTELHAVNAILNSVPYYEAAWVIYHLSKTTDDMKDYYEMAETRSWQSILPQLTKFIEEATNAGNVVTKKLLQEWLE